VGFAAGTLCAGDFQWAWGNGPGTRADCKTLNHRGHRGTEERRLWMLGAVIFDVNLPPDPGLGLVSVANGNNDFAIEPGEFITSP